MRFALFLAMLAVPATADERRVFYGTWGTEKQCARSPIKPGVTVLSEPFEISQSWLRQGQLWCRLSWFPVDKRKGDFFTGARAQCGEDTVRDYVLRFKLSGSSLTLSWGPFVSNGPLARCK